MSYEIINQSINHVVLQKAFALLPYPTKFLPIALLESSPTCQLYIAAAFLLSSPLALFESFQMPASASHLARFYVASDSPHRAWSPQTVIYFIPPLPFPSTLFIPPHVLSNAQQQSRGQSLIWLVLRFNPDFMQQCSAILLCQKALRMRLLFSQSSLANVSHYQGLDAVK